MLWQQFRRRMDNERPYCLVLGQTEEEVRHILTTFEEIYRKHHAIMEQFRGRELGVEAAEAFVNLARDGVRGGLPGL